MSCEQPLSVLICRVQEEELIEKREAVEHLIRVGHRIIRNFSELKGSRAIFESFLEGEGDLVGAIDFNNAKSQLTDLK